MVRNYNWWVDHCGTRRYGRGEGVRRINRIHRLGLPCTIQYAQNGNCHQLIYRTRPGFTHLSSPHTVRRCIQGEVHYHSTLAFQNQLQDANLGWANTALQRVQARFANPVFATLQIVYVNPNTSVVHINPAQAVFLTTMNDILFLRQNFGSHSGNHMTISM